MKNVTKQQIDEIIEQSEFETFHRVFGKQCIVVAKLPDGFTIVGESACVDPKNYDESIGTAIAMQRIEEEIWKLQGYLLQNRIYDAERGE